MGAKQVRQCGIHWIFLVYEFESSHIPKGILRIIGVKKDILFTALRASLSQSTKTENDTL